MALAGSTDDDGPEDEITASESSLVEHDDESRPDTRLYKKVKAFNAFIDQSLRGLKPSEAVVWLVLFRFARDGLAVVPKETIAKRAGFGERTVARSIRTLERLGLVQIPYRGGLGKGANKYRLGIKTLEQAQKPPKKAHEDAAEITDVVPGVEDNKAITD